MIDVKRLIGEVAAQNGIRLDPHDPAFALVTLNELVLEEAANRLYERVSVALAQFTDSLSKAEHLAGRTLAQEVKIAAADIRKDWAGNSSSMQPASTMNNTNARLAICRWLAIGAFSGAVLVMIGIACGKMLAG